MFRRVRSILAFIAMWSWAGSVGAAGPTMIDVNRTMAAQSASLEFYPGMFVTTGATTYFRMRPYACCAELWKTDGTAAGTVRLNPGLEPSGAVGTVRELAGIAVGGRVFFSGDWCSQGAPTSGWEPCASDGTSAGTYQIAD